MAIERWDPFRQAMTMRDAMDWLFQRSVLRPDWAPFPESGWYPMDVEEGDNEFVIRASVPGWKPEEIDVSVQGNTVTISGHRKAEEREEKGKTYHLRERSFASFSRSFTLPMPVDSDKAQATYENGELQLTIPKSEAVRPRRIEVKGSSALPSGKR